jgi:photosystem II stability/assembly factor-like uncharacterized protein
MFLNEYSMKILAGTNALIILISFNLFAQGEWIKLNSPASLKFEKLFCFDSLNCWAAGDSGLIIHTSNGGLTWAIQSSGVSEKIQDIYFSDNNTGWAVSTRFDSVWGSYIIKTTNGGELWQKEFFNIENNFFQTIYFFDSSNGWVAGSPSKVFYGTTDGGFTWNSPRFDSGIYSGLPVQKIIFYSEQYGFAVGGRHDLMGVIWKTTDAGLTWSSKNMGFEPLRDFYFIDSLNIVGVGGDFEYGTAVARTSDGGENWLYELQSYLGVATGLSFRTTNEAWACLGSESKFILSIDSGKTWSAVNTLNNAAIYDVVFTDSLNGFAVGDSGVILKYQYNGTSDVKDININTPSTFNLFQNYPNPFNPETKIRYEISNVFTNTSSRTKTGDEGTMVQLKVYDLLGNQIITLVEEFKQPGIYEVDFNASSAKYYLTSGVYFYQLKIGMLADTKKMILLR